MEHQFWLERWQLGEIGFHQSEFNAHLTGFWHQLGLKADARVLVPLCGKSRDMLWLRSEGHPVVGVELAEAAVQNFFQENQLAPALEKFDSGIRYTAEGLELLCGDLFKFSAADLGAVNAIYDRAALIALPPAMRPQYVRQLVEVLTKSVPILLVTMAYDQAEMAGPPFSVPESEVESLYGEYFRIQKVYQHDLLTGEEGKRWKARGLTQASEQVYLMTPKVC